MRDLTPIGQRPTAALQMKFDRLCSNHLIADAIEAFAILQELQRRALIESINNDNLPQEIGATAPAASSNPGDPHGAPRGNACAKRL